MMRGSSLTATQSPYISTFQEGWREVATLVPSVRIMFLGLTMIIGIVAPNSVRIKKAIWESSCFFFKKKEVDERYNDTHKFHCQLCSSGQSQ